MGEIGEKSKRAKRNGTTGWEYGDAERRRRVLSAMLEVPRDAAVTAVIFVTIEECNIVTPSDKSCLRIAV